MHHWQIMEIGQRLNDFIDDLGRDEFINDMTSAQIIMTDEDKTEAKTFTENIISKHRLLQRQFGIAFLQKETTHIVIIE